jgi:hypothetical protein
LQWLGGWRKQPG